MITSKETLDAVAEKGCETCANGAEHGERHERVYLHPRCHPGAGLWAYYEDNALTVICKQCRQEVLSVEPK
jgi:hypothetical protein